MNAHAHDPAVTGRAGLSRGAHAHTAGARILRSLAASAILAACAAPAGSAAQAAEPAAPFGLWKTFDDHTGQARALVRIYRQDGALFGKIEQSFTPGAEQRRCHVCRDERHDQPVLGLIIIRNMKPDGDAWSGGDILDPDSGTVYRCRLHLAPDGHLVVRGYIGISLLGRSQTWQRQG